MQTTEAKKYFKSRQFVSMRQTRNLRSTLANARKNTKDTLSIFQLLSLLIENKLRAIS